MIKTVVIMDHYDEMPDYELEYLIDNYYAKNIFCFLSCYLIYLAESNYNKWKSIKYNM